MEGSRSGALWRKKSVSAVNVIRQQDAVHVLTDGAAFFEDGTVEFIGPKAFPLPHMNLVLALRGAATMPMVLPLRCPGRARPTTR